ncbi:immunoglobulin superfamily member 8 [Anguilla rostrata]|uniref:immunoglobulin superfamily member 8 n=1 Tax=Anguilla rostrata TaxID=7938 RepID=UPI0030CEDF9E
MELANSAPVSRILVGMASWTTFICLQWALQCVVCREVTLPSGPLFRVAGFPLTLPCVVSGYEGPRTQDFEWFLYREDAGGRQMGVVSTRDRGFPYAPYQPRVRSGEVRVERDAGDRVRLVVQRLRPEDQGRYECYTPSTDSRYQGNYSASVVVKVIPDTLQISHSRALIGQSLVEGSELQLTCSAAVQSKQHTHLSVTFGVRGAGPGGAGGAGQNLTEVVSFGRDLAVVAGRGGDYARRCGDGEIALEKRRGQGDGDRDLYLMKMAAVAPGDSGAYVCEAAQWILDPEGVWERIALRTMDLGTLTVQPLADTMTVATTPRGEVSLLAESPLSLTCEVGGVGAWSRTALQVQWMRRAGEGAGRVMEVARLSPDGVVTWGDDTSRGGGGAVEKVGEGRYSLRLFSAYPTDAGVYLCVVSVYAGNPSPGPATPPTVTRRSEGVNVRLQTKVPTDKVTVAMTPRGEVTLSAGSPLSMMCEVGGVRAESRSALLVQWMRRGGAGEGGAGPEMEVARLSPDGVVTWGDDTSRGAGGAMEKVGEGRYSLRLFSAYPTDAGVYLCVVSVYAGNPSPGPATPPTVTRRSEGVNVRLQTKEVSVSTVAEVPPGPLLKRGSTVSVLCNVSVTTGGPFRVEVQWLMRREAPGGAEGAEPLEVEEGGATRPLAALTHDGLARFYGNGSEVSVERLAAGCYRLRVHAAQPEDQGLYGCLAQVWAQDPGGAWRSTGARAESDRVRVYLYSRATDLLLIPLVVGVSSALFVGVFIVATVTCCFMNRLARQRSQK